jgi:hypothetical protein
MDGALAHISGTIGVDLGEIDLDLPLQSMQTRAMRGWAKGIVEAEPDKTKTFRDLIRARTIDRFIVGTRSVKILERAISPTLMTSSIYSLHLEFQSGMAHTEAHGRRRGRGEMRHELENAPGICLGIGERPTPASS